MVFSGFKLTDTVIEEWLNSKKNKSATIKEALKEKYQRELNEKKKQSIEVEI